MRKSALVFVSIATGLWASHYTMEVRCPDGRHYRIGVENSRGSMYLELSDKEKGFVYNTCKVSDGAHCRVGDCIVTFREQLMRQKVESNESR